MNVVCLVGRLTADPELRQTPNGTNVCSFSVAVNRAFANANGERQADFINCVAWRQTAEFIARYFGKGDNIGINGTIQTRTYQDKDTGKNRTAFEVVVNNAYFTSNVKKAESKPKPDILADVPPPPPPPEESFQQQSLVPQKSRRTDLQLPENEYDALEGFGYTPDGDLPF